MERFKRHWFAVALVGVLLLVGTGLIAGIFVVSSLKNKGSEVMPVATEGIEEQSSATATAIKHIWKKGAFLEIPAIKIVAPIEEVGIQGDGDMAVPVQHQWEGVGWYKFGAFPGDQGSAVIDGHLDRPGGYPAVFWNLSKLRVGDRIEVVNPGEKAMFFRVKDLQYYRPQDAPLPRIFGDRSGVYLNLITCAGTWIPAIKQTTLRLVVYTEMVQ